MTLRTTLPSEPDREREGGREGERDRETNDLQNDIAKRTTKGDGLPFDLHIEIEV